MHHENRIERGEMKFTSVTLKNYGNFRFDVRIKSYDLEIFQQRNQFVSYSISRSIGFLAWLPLLPLFSHHSSRYKAAAASFSHVDSRHPCMRRYAFGPQSQIIYLKYVIDIEHEHVRQSIHIISHIRIIV